MSKTEVVHDFNTVINSLVAYRANVKYGAISDKTLAAASEELANVSNVLVTEMHNFFSQINEEQTAALFGYTIGRAMGFAQMIDPSAPVTSPENVSRIFTEGIQQSCEITKAEVKHGVETGVFTIEQLKSNTVKNVENRSTKKGTERKIILPH